MDLRLDIERRKKYSTHERYYNEDQGRDVGDSPDSSRDRSVENFYKYHKKSKKSKKKKKRSRSSSSSSSSSSKSNKDEGLPQQKPDSKNGDFNKNRLGQRESSGSAESGHPHGGFQVRIRGRNWSKGNYQGNISHSNPVSMVVHQKSEDWDPEYTPKSKKYYLHDDRDEESECKWTDNRGRGRGSFTRGRARFLIRKATGGPNIIYPKWGLDKFQVNEEQGGMQREETEQDHKRAEVGGENN